MNQAGSPSVKQFLRSGPATRGQLVILWLLCTAMYSVNARVIPEVDCVPPSYEAWNLVRHGNLELGAYRPLDYLHGSIVIKGTKGQWLCIHPPGKALMMVPFIAPLAMTMDEPPRDLVMNRIGKVMGVVTTATAVAIFFITVSMIAPGGAWLATLLLAFGTNLQSVASQASWAHGPTIMWVSIGALGMVMLATGRFKRGVPVACVIGFSFGMAVTCRQMTALYLPPVCMAIWAMGRFRLAVIIGAVALIPVGSLMLYQHAMYGHAVMGGYGTIEKAWATSIYEGMAGLLVSPSRGLFIFTPALLIALVGLVMIAKPASRLATPVRLAVAAVFIGGLLQLPVSARWYDWPGGNSFGPRFLINSLIAWGLLFAIAWERLRKRRAWHGIIISLVAISTFIHVHSCFFRRGHTNWHIRFYKGLTTVWSVSDNLIWSNLTNNDHRGPGDWP